MMRVRLHNVALVGVTQPKVGLRVVLGRPTLSTSSGCRFVDGVMS